MAIKTRDRFIDVARQLFAKKGIEKTTMNDIACASDKGRRTIYTYFKNKREIYNAVIEHESELLVGTMRDIAHSNMPSVEKLERFLEKRFEIIRDSTSGQGRLKSFIQFDSKRIDRIRHLAQVKINEMVSSMLAQGVNEGCFDPTQVERLQNVLSATIQGVDSIYIHGINDRPDFDSEKFHRDIIQFIISAITTNE